MQKVTLLWRSLSRSIGSGALHAGHRKLRSKLEISVAARWGRGECFLAQVWLAVRGSSSKITLLE